EDSDRVVQIFQGDDLFPAEGGMISWNQYVDYREHPHLFEAVAISDPNSKIFGPEDVEGRKVTPDYFEVMKVRPVIGRFFTQEESQPGSDRVLVLSQNAWEKYFFSDPKILGEEIRFLNEASYTIIGVAPSSLEIFDSEVRYFIPWIINKFWLDPQRRLGWAKSDFWARLSPGVTHQTVITELNLIERSWAEEVANAENRRDFEESPLKFFLNRPHPLKNRLILLQAGALLVLLVGCANIVNLILSRTNSRIHELSTRYALGARKTVLARAMLMETFILATCGAVVAMLLTWGALGIINRYLLVLFPKGQPVVLTETVFFWTLLIMITVAIVMGLLPIILFWKTRVIQKGINSDKNASASRSSRSLSSGLVICQVAITFTLLVSTGLLIRSFYNVLAVDPGFEAAQILKGKVLLGRFYREKESVAAITRIKDAIREIAGVEQVGLISSVTDTVGEHPRTGMVTIRGGSSLGDTEPVLAVIRFVDEEFFATMDIELIQGQFLYSGDEAYRIGKTGIKTSYIVDETFANQYLKDRIVVGSQILRGSDPPTSDDGWLTVEGVASRANFEGLERRDGLPVLYVCRDRAPWSECNLLIRTNRSPVGLIPEVRNKLKEVDARLFFSNPTTLDVELNKLHYDRQGITLLTIVFAALTLVISAIGIYGVLSYDVEQRQREMGIRSAIGASRSKILFMVLGQGLWKTLIGLGLGLIGSLYLNRYLERRLFDVTALDPWTYAIVFIVLLSVALAASYLPARRAVRVNPVEALRAE
ncbi:MAG: ABC transporter permease, partial [Verrucomicrobia bacterium]|nr:ABC transporter permease [Verrucomicrobiota bacterium]